MPNMTLSIPKELYFKMKRFPEFKWSEVARQAFEQRIKDENLLRDLKELASVEKEFKEGKTISHKELLKEQGLSNEL